MLDIDREGSFRPAEEIPWWSVEPGLTLFRDDLP
jgi:hypothetical protein